MTLDSLTWLPGRQAFQRRLADTLRKAGAHKRLAVVAIDVDRMHAVNGMLGRDLGDRVLREAAARMARALGPGVLLARLQEDDFAAFALVEDRAAAGNLARAVVDACRVPYLLGCVSVSATASAGVAVWPTDAADSVELLHRAEEALQSAKLLGGNRSFPHAGTGGGPAGLPSRTGHG